RPGGAGPLVDPFDELPDVFIQRRVGPDDQAVGVGVDADRQPGRGRGALFAVAAAAAAPHEHRQRVALLVAVVLLFEISLVGFLDDLVDVVGLGVFERNLPGGLFAI